MIGGNVFARLRRSERAHSNAFRRIGSGNPPRVDARAPLGTWITLVDGEIVVNHVPFVLDSSRGPLGALFAHVARANPVWKSFSTTVSSVVVFQGVESYISPSWYPSKQAHGKAVPTWNYVTVHARGIHIVGIEIPIRALRGKWKTSQNRSPPDRHGVVDGLRAKGDHAAREMAELVARRIELEAQP
ncbi:MAG: FMN-binding negative transcriptional regulator [Gammaproteobacteria bacterium]|nr:hypothetical protein [Gammaproteobacteria bacterium]